MKRVQRLLIALMTALIVVIFTHSASADAPAGGYSIVPTKVGEPIVIEVGPGLYWPKVFAAFNPGYKATTGKDLTIEDVQAINESATFPVCNGQWKSRGKGLTGGDVAMWKDCPAGKRQLGFVAGVNLTIPLVKVETAIDKFEREKKILASWNDAKALSARIVELGGTAPVVAPKPAVPTKVDEPKADSLKKQPALTPAVQPKVTDDWSRSRPVTTYVIAMVILFAIAWFGSRRWYARKEDRRVNNLQKTLEELIMQTEASRKSERQRLKMLAEWFGFEFNEDSSSASVFRAVEKQVTEFATAFGIQVTDEMGCKDIHLAIGNESNRRIKKKAADVTRLTDEIKVIESNATRRIATVQSEANRKIEQEISRYAAIQTELQNQLDEFRAAYARSNQLKNELATIERDLAPMHKELIAFDDERTVMRRDIGELKSKYDGSADGTEERFNAERELSAKVRKVQEISALRQEVLAHMKPYEARRDEILVALTGRPDKTLALYKEAQHDRNDAAEDRGKAGQMLEDAMRIRREAESFHASAMESTQHIELRTRELDDREGQIAFFEGMTSVHLNAVLRLLEEAMRFVGLDPATTSLNDIMALDGAPGIYAQVMQQYSKLAAVNTTLGDELSRTRNERDRIESDYNVLRARTEELNFALNNTNAMNVELQARVAELASDVDRISREHAEAAERLTQAPDPAWVEQRESEYTMREQGLQDQIAELTGKIRELQSQLDMDPNIAKIAELEAQIAGLGAQVDEKERLLKEAEIVIDERATKISKLEATAEERERVLAQRGAAHDQLVANVAVLQRELESVNTSYSELVASMRGNGSHIRLSQHQPIVDRQTRTSHPTDPELLPPDSSRDFEELITRMLEMSGRRLLVHSFEFAQKLIRMTRMLVELGPEVEEKIPNDRRSFWSGAKPGLTLGKLQTTFTALQMDIFLPNEGGTERPPALAGAAGE